VDIHRPFAQVAILEDSEFTKEVRVALVHDRIIRFVKSIVRGGDKLFHWSGGDLQRILGSRQGTLPHVCWT